MLHMSAYATWNYCLALMFGLQAYKTAKARALGRANNEENAEGDAHTLVLGCVSVLTYARICHHVCKHVLLPRFGHRIKC